MYSRTFGLIGLMMLFGVSDAALATDAEGTRRVTVLNYSDCIQLENETTRVVLGHHRGGRVLRYEHQGKESLYLDPAEGQWEPGSNQRIPVSAGRFDIGPEQVIPRREILWSGPWEAEVIGPRAARLTSQEHPETGVQLVREFRLAASGSHLACTQIIRNVSQKTVAWNHWSRTFALGHGICVIPLSPESKYPNHYVMYEPGGLIKIRPEDPNIRRRDGFLEILAAPKYPKLGMDSMVGWFAYQMPNDLLFVKRYATHPDRVYHEVAGLSISIWYPQGPMVELEPIGPRERLKPGEAAAFTEHWWLLDSEHPADGTALDLQSIRSKVEQQTALPKP